MGLAIARSSSTRRVGCEEVLTQVRLATTSDAATQLSFLALIDVSIVDYSNRYEGACYK